MRGLSSVLFVNYEYPPLGGGGGVFTRHLAEELARRVAVTVLTSRGPGLPLESIENGVRVIRAPVLMRRSTSTASLPSLLSFLPASLCYGRTLVDRERFDVVHSFFAVPSACSGLPLARRARVPHVLTALGGDVYDPTKALSPHRTPLLFHAVKSVMCRTDRLIALSSDIRTRALLQYGVRREIDVVPVGIPRPVFRTRARGHFGLQASDIVLVTVGRLVARKGIDQLLEVVARLEDPAVKLAVVGEGPLRARLRQAASSLGISDRVRFFGFLSDEEKWQLLHCADIYASTALHEGFGIVFLEAMQAGLPVVTNDEGGQRDFVRDGETGFLVRLGERDTFIQRLQRLCREPVLRRRLGACGRRAAGAYRVERIAERYLGIYTAARRGGSSGRSDVAELGAGGREVPGGGPPGIVQNQNADSISAER